MDDTEDTRLPVSPPLDALTSKDAVGAEGTDVDEPWRYSNDGDDGSDGSTWELMQDEGRWPAWL